MTFILMIIGAIVMMFGLLLCFKTITLLKNNKSTSEDLRNWYIIFILVLFFMVTYFIVIYLIYNDITSPLLLLIGVVFLFGSLFVVLLNYLSKKTLSMEIKRKASFERFVPKEFLQQLAKNDIIDVQLGDQIEKEITVMVSDIRSFTSLSAEMKPYEVFQFLNEYLHYILPVIKSNLGFVDKFLGDGMLAIFPKQDTRHSVRCAIQMFEALKKWNTKQNHDSFI